MLTQILTTDVVALDADGIETPEDVLRFAGNLMVKAGKITEPYIKEVIEAYHKLGPYFLMAPGIAMPHARPSEAVLETGISFVRLKNPVKFNHPENDPVRLVFLLAGTQSGGHLDMIGELGELLSDENALEKLHSIQTYQELESLLSKKL